MRKLLLITLLLAFPVMAMASGDQAWVDNPTTAGDKMAAQGLQQIMDGRWTAGRQSIADSKLGIAAKIYYWLNFTQKSQSPDNYVKLTRFVRENPDWPQIWVLIKKAEETMPASLEARDVIAWFSDYKPRTARGLDRYASALLSIGQKDKTRELLSDWWAKTPLSRDDQVVLFRKYNIYLNTQSHWQRLDMLLHNGQESNALAIAQVLGQDYVALARARLALSEDQGNINGLIAQVPAKLQNDPGLLYERLRWRRKHDLNDGAIEILNKESFLKKIQNPDAWWKERHILIRRLIEEKNYKRAYTLAATHQQKSGISFAQAEWTAGWLALRFLKKPSIALQHFEVLEAGVETPISKSRAEYWAGRAAEDMGQRELMQQWYKKAASKQTTYYGQMAAAELSVIGELTEVAPPKLTPEDKRAFAKSELIQAARLFHLAGQRKTASEFIQAFVSANKTAKAYMYAIEISASMQHYHDVVNIAKKATQEGLFLTAQSYPVVSDKLKNVSLEWALVHGLIRQESSFDVEARSPVGALGLMQLMPATAKETAQKMGIAHQTYWLTSNPEHNIRLGSEYLRRLLVKYDGAYPLAIAAYNAGPGRVDQWLKLFGDPRKGEVDIIDWIELIPIYETRNYVQRVIESTYVYRLRLKGQQKDLRVPVSLAMPQNLKGL